MPMRPVEKKPFCDGTHAKVGFDGTETASRESYVDQAKVLDGPPWRSWMPSNSAPSGVLRSARQSVESKSGAPMIPHVRAMFIRQVGDCPAGRLVAWDKAAGKALEPDLPVSIGLVEDPSEGCSGPLWLRGGIAVISGGWL